MNRKTFGTQGETETAAYLQARGYRIVDANVRPLGGMARGEIDLIAWHRETLVFIEVKSRRTALGAQGTPGEAVDARKRRQLVQLAGAYIAKHDLDNVPCRFDVVELVRTPGTPTAFLLLVNAFDGTEL